MNLSVVNLGVNTLLAVVLAWQTMLISHIVENLCVLGGCVVVQNWIERLVSVGVGLVGRSQRRLHRRQSLLVGWLANVLVGGANIRFVSHRLVIHGFTN